MMGTAVAKVESPNHDLDAAGWSEFLNVKAKAHTDAKNDRPPSEAKELSLTEREVVRTFESNIRAREAEQRKQVDACRTRLSKIFNDSTLEDLHGLPAQLETENTDAMAQEHERLAVIRDNARNREVDLRKFQEVNGLEREAVPREDSLVSLLWVSGIVVVETVLNATFFASGSERGLLGGIIQAFVISFINVYAAWLCGRYCLPRLSHVQSGIRLTGMGYTFAAFGAVLVLNIFAGHYRSALEQDPFVAVINAVLTFREDFLGIRSAQGWLLSGVGLVAALGLTIKIFKSDDPYLGYGDIYRLWEAADTAWVEARAAFTMRIRANYERIENMRRVLSDKLTDLELQCRRQMDIAYQTAEDFHDYCHDQERLCNHVVNDYRKANCHVRDKAHTPPAYFDESVCLHVDSYGVKVDFGPEQARFQAMVDSFESYREKDSSEIKQQLLDIHEQSTKSLETYFKG